MLNSLWSTAIAICNQVNMIIFAYASLDIFSVLTRRGHVQMWVSQDFIRQRFCTASTTLTVMIYCICCSFCPIFFSSRKAIQLLGKKIFTHDARGFTTFLQDGIIRIARSVLSQSPDSEITLSTPQVFLIVHIFLTHHGFCWTFQMSAITFWDICIQFCRWPLVWRWKNKEGNKKKKTQHT